MRNSRLLLLALLSLTATGLVIGSALRDNHRSEAVAAALALRRAAAVTPAPVTASTTPAAATAPAHNAATPAASHSSSPAADASPASTPAPTTTSTPKTSPAPKPPAAPTSTSKVKHVFVIPLSGSFDPASAYLGQQLRPQGELLSGYKSLAAVSELPSYVATISGQPPNAQTSGGCTTYSEFPGSAKTDKKGIVSGDGCVYPVSTLTIADQITSAGQTWKAYLEDMQSPCEHPDSGEPDQTQAGPYAARHNPFVYFHSLLDLGDCATNDVPLTQLSTDLATAKSTPSFSFIAPNLCHDGTDTTCGSADDFAGQLVPQVLASPAFKKDGLLEVVFSSGALLVSRYVSAGGTDSAAYDPYSLLRTNEDIFGVTHLGEAAATKVESFGGGLITGAGD